MNVHSVETEADLDAFLKLPFDLYRGDAAWVAPLESRERFRLDARRNGFFRHAERALFLARRDGRVVGRIAAVHDEADRTRTGMVGFFECEDDVQASNALFAAANAWLRARGATSVVGPKNLTEMDEFGVVVNGHTRRPPFMTGHSPAYYARLFLAAGFEKSRDTLAYERFLFEQDGRPSVPPEGLLRAAAPAANEFTIRALDVRRWDEEVATACHIINASFEGMEGHAPFRLEEFAAIARELKPMVDPRLMLLAEHHGRPAGFAFLFPDVNEVLAAMNGKLYPFGWLKALWAKRRVSTASFKLAGVLPEHRKAGLAARLALEASVTAQRLGYRRLEMSVVNESNTRMRDFIALQGAVPYLRFRLFRKELA